MEELEKALEIRQKYLQMSYQEFAKLFEECYGYPVVIAEEEWKFTGLCNIDLFNISKQTTNERRNGR